MDEKLDDLRTDPEAREAFRADPHGWLARHGVALPEGRRVVVHENSETEFHVVLPSLGESGELSEADLGLVAGGAADNSFMVPEIPDGHTASDDDLK